MTENIIKDVRLIQEKMKQAQDHQKSYTNDRRQDLEFVIGDKVFCEDCPYHYMMRFRLKGKLTLRFVGLYKILERVGKLAQKLALPVSIDMIHNVFHMPLLRKYLYGLAHMLRVENVELEDNLIYKEKQIQIIDK